MELWEILVPTIRNDGRPIRTRFHRVWDKKVREITGGLTIMRPAKGQWVDEEDGQVYKERMIPVRFAVETEEQLQTVVEETFKHYDDQIAIMYYLISKDARITLRSEL